VFFLNGFFNCLKDTSGITALWIFLVLMGEFGSDLDVGLEFASGSRILHSEAVRLLNFHMI
jgi:hypothetical protein